MDREESDALFASYNNYIGFQELQKNQDLINRAANLYSIQRLGQNGYLKEPFPISLKIFQRS